MAQYKKYFTVSFDDGLEQDKKTLDVMRKYGIKGTFNLNSGLLGQKGDIKYMGKYGLANVDKGQRKRGFWKFADSDRIPADEIRQVYEGMELCTHSVHHVDLSKLSEKDASSELLQDREALQRFTDLPVVGHAFPFGKTSDAVEQALKTNGFLYARGIKSEKGKQKFAFPEKPLNFNPTCWHIESDMEKLLDLFLAAEPENGDMLFYLWGHGYEFDFASLKGLRNTYERMFDKLACHDEIIKCTNAEAFLSQKK